MSVYAVNGFYLNPVGVLCACRIVIVNRAKYTAEQCQGVLLGKPDLVGVLSHDPSFTLKLFHPVDLATGTEQ